MNQIVNFNFGAAVVRTVVIQGEPWFVAKDICEILGLGNVARALVKIPDNLKDITPINTLGGTQRLYVVSEAGLYRLILRSDKMEAEPLMAFVTEEVLPTIRKTGGVYMTPQKTEELLADPDLIIGLAMQVKQIKAERDEAIRAKAYVAAGREGTLLSKVGHLTKKVNKLEAKLAINGDYLAAKAIPWLAECFNVKRPGTWTVIGQQLRKLSIDLGHPIMKVDDPRWGQVNAYHNDVIDHFEWKLAVTYGYLRDYRK